MVRASDTSSHLGIPKCWCDLGSIIVSILLLKNKTKKSVAQRGLFPLKSKLSNSDPLLLTTKLYCLPEITVRVYWHVGLGEDDERSLKGEWG